MADFFTLPKEVQHVAETELFEVPSRVKDDIAYIRKWLSKQTHIHARTDDYTLLTFLRSCKFSLERTKEKLELFYKVRTAFPELYRNRDPFQVKIQNFFNQRSYAILPETVDGPVVVMTRLEYANPDTVSVNDILKMNLIVLDVAIRNCANGTVIGHSFIMDLSNFRLKYLVQITPAFLKKMVLCTELSYPARINAIHVLNLHPAFLSAFNMVKSLLPKKIQKRIYCHAQGESHCIKRYFPSTILPTEYGGTAGSYAELSEKLQIKVESYDKWLIEGEQYRSIEEKRPINCELNVDFFSLDGSFRKLEID